MRLLSLFSTGCIASIALPLSTILESVFKERVLPLAGVASLRGPQLERGAVAARVFEGLEDPSEQEVCAIVEGGERVAPGAIDAEG